MSASGIVTKSRGGSSFSSGNEEITLNTPDFEQAIGLETATAAAAEDNSSDTNNGRGDDGSESIETVEEDAVYKTPSRVSSLPSSINEKEPVQEVDPNQVTWDGADDQEDARRASSARKWMYCLLLTSATLALTALSSAWAMCIPDLVDTFHVGREVGELGLSLYLLGLCTGPLFLAPLSEFYGRKPLYIGGLLVFFVFQFPTAFPNNIASALIARFFVSLGGSVFMSNVPGTFADVFTNPRDLSLAMTMFTLGPFLGPGIGPVVSGFIVQHAGYRWVFYVFLMWSFALTVAIPLLVPETLGPVNLRKKARRLRKRTGNQNLYAPMEKVHKSILKTVRNNATRPMVLLFSEPMLVLLCFYTGFLLAVIYLFFVAFPMVFEEVYGFETQFVGLSFLGVTIGMAIAAGFYPIWHRKHAKDIAKNGGVPLPEMRLPQMCVGSVISPIGLFMFAWTVYRRVHWMAPIIASGIFGFGCYMTFNAILIYTVEAYRPFAASATAANVFVRCLMAASAPLFGEQMLNAMGFHWGVSLLAFVATALCPSSFIFLKYGAYLRSKSKHAFSS